MINAKVLTFIRRHAALWPIVLMSVLLFVGFYFFPWVSDDIGFRMPFRDHFLYGAPVSYSSIWQAFGNLMHTNNSRLANLAMFHLQFLPQWLTSAMTAVICGLSIYLSLRLINRENNFISSLLMCSAFVVLLPWVDCMYIFDFQLNYLWATFLLLLFVVALLQNNKKWYILFILGLIVGVWQEGSGLPTLIGCISLLLFYKNWRNPRTISGTIGIFIGLLWLWFSPGAINYRLNQPDIASSNKIVFIYYIPVFIYGAIYLWLLSKRKVTAIETALMAIAITPCLVVIRYPIVRLMMCGDLAACIGIIGIIDTNQTKIKSWISMAVFSVICAHLIAVDEICYIERKNYNYIINKLFTTPANDVIYAELLSSEDRSIFTMCKPNVNNFSHYTNSQVIISFWSGNDSMRCIVPRQLEGIKSSDGEVIAGNDGFIYINRYIVGPSVNECPCRVALTVESGGHTFSEEYYHVPFMTADGKKMAWYHPDKSSLRDLLFLRPELLKFQ